ncbi:MAG TPA: L-threonylcarbamoyladenylate synthase [Bacilli bacterium]|nr:L-threonylcarbamoyladenylate synthase [Bacilli bacterium]
MKTAQLTYKNLDTAASVLKTGGLVAFPTETVYGLAVVYDNEVAFKSLVEVKRRRPDKPFTLMCGTTSDILNYAYVSELSARIINAFLPGPLTIVLPSLAQLPSWVDLETGKVGIRVSSMQTIRELIIKVGKPLLVPSANRADEPPALTGEDAMAIFDGQIDAVIMGHVIGGTPSTVIEIDKEDNVKLLRKGPLTYDQIMAIAKPKESL